MSELSLLLAGAALFLVASCSGNKALEATNAVAVADTAIFGKGETGNTAQNLTGVYTDLNDGSTLEIGDSASLGLSVRISLFRLTDIDDGVGRVTDGVLTFTATDAAGQPIGGKITFDGDTARLAFTRSEWEYLPKGTTYSFVRGAKVDYEPANPIGGRTYAGAGKGGGLATNVTIRFDKDGTCQCISDFYQAFSKPVTVNGTYSIRYDIVEVRCQPPGFDTPIVWNFEIIDDGQALGFNNSDASADGSIGTDWLWLQVQ
ncbi:MAG: hypothetical protein NC117_08465 [Pseudoflavonifractor sp.]|nr:hypothetical protein [Pseudoflavonifractor sp.]